VPAEDARAVRAAVAADAPALRALAERAYAPYVPLIGRRPAPMDADIAAQIAAGEVHVATDATGAIRGFVVFRPEGGHMLLENVAVLPEEAGRGTGRALIRFCEETAHGRGLAAVRLYTNARMTANLALYPRLGYAETGRRTEDGFDRVFFEKLLAGKRR
jgi:ribosomal protein S18 acetylase RimI-like enzyme